MSLPILQPQSTTNPPQIRGDVTIDPNVMIASGVILNATLGYQIIIHAGVCLGMGTIITAHQGNVEIEANAILGPGTLILGNCTIGSQASLGTSVTVYNADVDALAVISAGSIIGDSSRRVETVVTESVVIDQAEDIIPADKTRHQSINNNKTTSAPSPTHNSHNNINTDNNLIDKINQLNQNGYSPHSPDISTAQPAKVKSLDEVEAMKVGKTKSIDQTEVRKPSRVESINQTDNEVRNTGKTKSLEEIEAMKASKPKSIGETETVKKGKIKSLDEIEAMKVFKIAEEKARIQNIIETNNQQLSSPPAQQPRQQISTEDEKKKYQSYFYQNYLNKDIQSSNSPSNNQSPPITSEDTLPNSPSNLSSSQSQSLAKPQQVAGKAYINRLLYTLFPHKNKTDHI